MLCFALLAGSGSLCQSAESMLLWLLCYSMTSIGLLRVNTGVVNIQAQAKPFRPLAASSRVIVIA